MITLTPEPVKEFAIRNFGENDKIVLVAGTLVVACLISIVGGLGNGIQWIAVMTALQEATLVARLAGNVEIGGAEFGAAYIVRSNHPMPESPPRR